MDGKRFDQLAKGLSSGASRRRMLGGMGAVAGGLVTARTVSAKARPINPGCDEAGRTCTDPGGKGSCCGNLTCTAPGGYSSRCTSLNNKCCFEVGMSCKGHCECCGTNTACIKGKCCTVDATGKCV